MNRLLLKKCVGEAAGLMAACAALLFALFWINVWTVSLIETSQFQKILEPFWEKWSYLSPVPLDQLLSYPGRIALGFVAPAVLVIMSAWAIARGSDAISGEVSRGTMEMLLAQPVSRLDILKAHSAVTIAGAAVLAGAAWAGAWAGVDTVSVKQETPATWRVPLLHYEVTNPFAPPEPVRVPMSELVDPRVFAPAAFNLFALGFCIGGLATCVSSWDRFRWRSVGLAAGFCIVQFLMKELGMAAESLRWLKRVSFFTAYEPQVFVSVAVERPEQAWSWVLRNPAGDWSGLGLLSYNAILLGIGLAAYAAAAVIFSRRDLPAPL